MLNDPRTLAMWGAAGQLKIPFCIIVEFGQVPLLPTLLKRERVALTITRSILQRRSTEKIKCLKRSSGTALRSVLD